MAAPTIRQVVAAGFAASATRQVTTGTGTQPGDLLLALVCNDFNGATGIGPPGGTWATVAQVGTSGHSGMGAYTRPVTSAGAQTVTVGGDDSEGALIVYVLTGVDSVDAAATASGSGNSQAAPSVTTTAVDDLLVCCWCEGTFGGSSAYSGVPAGMTIDSDVTDPDGFIAARAAHEMLTASGATGTRSTTGASPDTGWAAVSVAVKGTGGGPSPVDDITASLPVTVGIGGTLDVPAASIPQLASPIPVTVDLGGIVHVPPATVPELTAPLPVSIDATGVLEVPTASVPQVTSSITMTVDLGGTVESPTGVTVEQVTSRLPVAAGIGGTVQAPPASIPALTSTLGLSIDLGVGGTPFTPMATVPAVTSGLALAVGVGGAVTGQTVRRDITVTAGLRLGWSAAAATGNPTAASPATSRPLTAGPATRRPVTTGPAYVEK